MRLRDQILGERLAKGLRAHSKQVRDLPGISSAGQFNALIEQLVESLRRIEYVQVLRNRALDIAVTQPKSNAFDPLKAAIYHASAGCYDEACWLNFLFVHFGRHKRHNWNLLNSIYSGMSDEVVWSWVAIRENVAVFKKWLDENERAIASTGAFGNHRKYLSLKAYSPIGTGSAVEGYVNWILEAGNHEALIASASAITNGDSKHTFDWLYNSMSRVPTFGRLAKFDYLTMLGKLRLAQIEPGSAYLKGSTGPLNGARLLFQKKMTQRVPTSLLEDWVVELGSSLGVGMQAIEDALCNWQKNPSRFIPFRG